MRKRRWFLWTLVYSIPLYGVTSWAATWYVDDSALPGGSGNTWTSAFNDLEIPLTNPTVMPGDEIWVARGLYKPGPAESDTFVLKSGVAIYGGFEGMPGTENNFGVRNPQSYITVLSGDIGGDDSVDTNGIVANATGIVGANSYHVVTSEDVAESAILDGFTITAGQANGGGTNNFGGGLFNQNGIPTLNNITFSGNSATGRGGGMSSEDITDPRSISPTLINVTFTGNSSSLRGGGMDNTNGSSPRLTNVTFIGNSATSNGGGMSNEEGSSPTLINVTFSGNSADYGGGMFNHNNSSPALANVTFSENSAITPSGGGGGEGGGMWNGTPCSATVENCIFWGNIVNRVGNARFEPQVYNQSEDTSASITDSLIEGATCPEFANCTGVLLGDDPLFVDANGPDDATGTLDDELRLKPDSPAIDAGSNSHVPVGINTDRDGKPRIVDGDLNGSQIVDLGAYEYFPPPTPTPTPTVTDTPSFTPTPSDTPTVTPTPTPIVQPPANVRAGGGKGTIRLVWDRNPEEGIVGYNVFRSAEMSNFAEKVKINSELLLDPVFIDGASPTLPLPEDGSDWYYQIQAVLDASGEIRTSVSNEVRGVEGQYVMQLPDIRAFQTDEGVYIPYPISTLNARGITENSFQILVNYPSDLVQMKVSSPGVADFERTALTENFQNISAVHNGSQSTVLIQGQTSQSGGSELTGEGNFVNLLFRVLAGKPEGTTGAFTFQQVIFRNALNQPVGVDKSDRGIITVGNTFRFGDVNGNTSILVDDQEAAAKLVIGAPTDERIKTAADLNADGVVDVADIVLFPDRFGTKGTFPRGESADAIGSQAQSVSVYSKEASIKGVASTTYEMDVGTVYLTTSENPFEMSVNMATPPGDLTGIAGIAMTVKYASDYLALGGVILADSLIGNADLFYDQHDLSRFWKAGRVRIIISANAEALSDGQMAKVMFTKKDMAPKTLKTEVSLQAVKLARSTGEDMSWNNEVKSESGFAVFCSPPCILLGKLGQIKNDESPVEDLFAFSLLWYE